MITFVFICCQAIRVSEIKKKKKEGRKKKEKQKQKKQKMKSYIIEPI